MSPENQIDVQDLSNSHYENLTTVRREIKL